MAKQYNPWTGFLEDTAEKANDSKTCDGKNEYEIHYTVPGKNGTMVGSGKGTNEQEAKADFMAYHKSENPTVTKVKLYKSLDKAIRNVDSVGSDARDVYNILAQALQNSTNPTKVSELISKAQGKLLEMAARTKDSKCKFAIDKSIRNCDRGGEVDILFYVDIDGNKVHETFSSNSAMNSRLNELKKHGVKRFKTWSHAEWAKSESEFRNTFNKIKGSL